MASKGTGRAVDQRDIAQMQIAMAAADQSFGAARAQQRKQALKRSAARLRQRFGIHGGEKIRHVAKRRVVLFDEPRERVEPGLGIDNWRVAVRGRDRAGKRVSQRGIDLSLLSETIERRVLVEAVHLDRPFDGFARSVEREAAIGFAGDGDDAAIKIRRKRPVDLEFALTRRLAFLETRIVEEWKLHRALHLVDALARKENGRRVGVDPPHARAAVRRGIAQEREDCVLGIALMHV